MYLIQNAFTGHVIRATMQEARFWAGLDYMHNAASHCAYNVYREGGSGVPVSLYEIA